jgi:hypothetical protein
MKILHRLALNITAWATLTCFYGVYYCVAQFVHMTFIYELATWGIWCALISFAYMLVALKSAEIFKLKLWLPTLMELTTLAVFSIGTMDFLLMANQYRADAEAREFLFTMLKIYLVLGLIVNLLIGLGVGLTLRTRTKLKK